MTNALNGNPVREFNSAGCFILLMSFSCNLLWGCIYKSLGVLLPTLRDQFTTHTWAIGTAITAIAVTSGIASFFTVFVEAKFGSRPVLITSMMMEGTGFMLVAVAPSVIHITLSLVLLVGPGIGLSNVINKAVLGRHFEKHLSLAFGIGHSGHAVALLAFAPLMQLFVDTYGWRGATLLMGGICMHGVVSAALVRDSKPQYHSLSDEPDSQTGNQRDDGNSTKALCSRLQRSLDVQIFKEFYFWGMVMCLCGLRFINDAWVVYFVPHAQAKGISPQVAAALCSAAAVGYLFGTVIWSPFIDRGLVKCSTAVIISTLTLALSFIVDPWVTDVLGLAVITLMFGLSSSALYTLVDVFTKEGLGSDRLTSAFGWAGAISLLPRLLSGFLPGLLYDRLGSYDLAFIIIGLLPAMTILPIAIGKLRKGI